MSEFDWTIRVFKAEDDLDPQFAIIAMLNPEDNEPAVEYANSLEEAAKKRNQIRERIFRGKHKMME